MEVARWLQSLDPVAYNVEGCKVYTKKEQQIKRLIYLMNQSGNENASTVDVVESLNEYIE